MGGLTLTPGVYCYASSALLTGTLTLDAQGDADAVFIFQIGSTLTTASGSSVLVINGGQDCNVFWQVGSSATLGTTTSFIGNLLALTSITLNTGATVSGRALARTGAVTLDSNTITRSTCAAAATATATRTATRTQTRTATSTSTSTFTRTPTPSRTPTSTPTRTPTRTATVAGAPSSTRTPTSTATPGIAPATAVATPGDPGASVGGQALGRLVPRASHERALAATRRGRGGALLAAFALFSMLGALLAWGASRRTRVGR